MKTRRQKQVHTPQPSDEDLAGKRPSELIAALEAEIDATETEDLDAERVQAYLAALQAKAPVAEDFDAAASLREFQARHTELFQADGKKQRPRQAWRRVFNTVAVACALLLVLTVAANAYDVNVFDMFVVWRGEIMQIGWGGRTPSGNLELPAGSGGEYRSLAEALDKNGYSAQGCPTWIPARFQLAGLYTTDAAFSAEYLDEEQNNLLIFVDLSATPETVITVEKDPDSEKEYVHHGVTYYLMTNMGRSKAVWLDGGAFYSVSGVISETELKQILDSIGEN